MEKFFARWAANALGLFVAGQVLVMVGLRLDFHSWSTDYLPDRDLPAWSAILVAALVLALVNTFVRPLVMVFTCLINFLTMGLFTLVVNAAMIGVTSWAMERFLGAGFVTINPAGLIAALAASVIIGVLNSIFNKLF